MDAVKFNLLPWRKKQHKKRIAVLLLELSLAVCVVVGAITFWRIELINDIQRHQQELNIIRNRIIRFKHKHVHLLHMRAISREKQAQYQLLQQLLTAKNRVFLLMAMMQASVPSGIRLLKVELRGIHVGFNGLAKSQQVVNKFTKILLDKKIAKNIGVTVSLGHEHKKFKLSCYMCK